MKPGMDSAATHSERIERIAAQWFFKRDSDAWTAADQVQLDEWLESSTAHRVAFLRLNAGWKRVARLKALGAGVPAGTIPPSGSWGDIRFPGGQTESQAPASGVSGLSTPRFSSGKVDNPETPDAGAYAHTRKQLKIAASVVLTLGIGLYAYNASFFQDNRYSTPIGGRDTIPLTDGSQVVLNTDTRIRVDLTDTERRVQLDKGEAFFDVARDATRPFVVQVGDKRVTAVGTKFSVRRVGDDIRVTVTEGKVRIDQPEAQSSPLLEAGNIAQTADTETLIRESSPPEVEQLLSWRSGYLVFEATPLADAVAEFNRYSPRKIVIEDAATAALRIGGNFRTDNAEAFLWLVQSGFPVNVEHHNDRIILTVR